MRRASGFIRAAWARSGGPRGRSRELPSQSPDPPEAVEAGRFMNSFSSKDDRVRRERHERGILDESWT